MFTIVIQQKNNIQTSQINFNFIQRTCQQEHVWILGPCSQAHHDWSNKEERCEKVSSQYPWKHFNATIHYDKSRIVKESMWNIYGAGLHCAPVHISNWIWLDDWKSRFEFVIRNRTAQYLSCLPQWTIWLPFANMNP